MTELTQGQQLVGLDFNPSKNEDVQRLKEIMAEAADIIYKHNQNQPTQSYNSNLIRGAALKSILEAQMMAVKYVTFKY